MMYLSSYPKVSGAVTAGFFLFLWNILCKIQFTDKGVTGQLYQLFITFLFYYSIGNRMSIL